MTETSTLPSVGALQPVSALPTRASVPQAVADLITEEVYRDQQRRALGRR